MVLKETKKCKDSTVIQRPCNTLQREAFNLIDDITLVTERDVRVLLG